MPNNLATALPIQKEVYEQTIQDWMSFHRKRAWNHFEKQDAFGGQAPAAGSATPPSRSSHFSAFVGYNAVGGAMEPDATFPTAGTDAYVQASYRGNTYFWPSMITRSAIRNTRGNVAAFAELQRECAIRAAQYADITLETDLLGDGSGTIGVISSNTGEDPESTNDTFYLANKVDARKFQVGMFINCWSARTAGATQRVWDDSPATYVLAVTGVNYETGMITLAGIDGTFTCAVADVITKGNDNGTLGASARTTTIRRTMMGLDGIVSDRDSPMETGVTYGGLFGILAPLDFAGNANTGGVATWASYVSRAATAGTSRAYNSRIIQNALSEAGARSGFTPNVIFTSYGGDLAVFNDLQGIRRSVNVQTISGGTSPGKFENPEDGNYIEFGNKIPVIPCRFAPVGIDSATATSAHTARTYTAKYICTYTPHIKIKEWHKPRLLDDDGQVMRMQGRTAQFESVLEYQAETICLQRNSHCKIEDIATDPV